MTITKITDTLEKAISYIDEVGHIPDGEITDIRNSLEAIIDKLDLLGDEYGDEESDNDPYGNNSDDYVFD